MSCFHPRFACCLALLYHFFFPTCADSLTRIATSFSFSVDLDLKRSRFFSLLANAEMSTLLFFPVLAVFVHNCAADRLIVKRINMTSTVAEAAVGAAEKSTAPDWTCLVLDSSIRLRNTVKTFASGCDFALNGTTVERTWIDNVLPSDVDAGPAPVLAINVTCFEKNCFGNGTVAAMCAHVASCTQDGVVESDSPRLGRAASLAFGSDAFATTDVVIGSAATGTFTITLALAHIKTNAPPLSGSLPCADANGLRGTCLPRFACYDGVTTMSAGCSSAGSDVGCCTRPACQFHGISGTCIDSNKTCPFTRAPSEVGATGCEAYKSVVDYCCVSGPNVQPVPAPNASFCGSMVGWYCVDDKVLADCTTRTYFTCPGRCVVKPPGTPDVCEALPTTLATSTVSPTAGPVDATTRDGGGGGDDNNTVLIGSIVAGALAGVLVLVVGAVGFACYRRRHAAGSVNNDNGIGMQTANNNSSVKRVSPLAQKQQQPRLKKPAATPFDATTPSGRYVERAQDLMPGAKSARSHYDALTAAESGRAVGYDVVPASDDEMRSARDSQLALPLPLGYNTPPSARLPPTHNSQYDNVDRGVQW